MARRRCYDDPVWMGELAAWARAMKTPKSVLVVSAHWDKRPATIGATTPVPLYYDFYGFPQRYYETQYPQPGAPALAAQVEQVLADKRIPTARDEKRGLDHGAFIPLLAMYPGANIPVLQLSLPGLDEKRLVELGTALAPLRDEGVLIFGSGFLTHNMRYAFQRESPRGRGSSTPGPPRRCASSTSTRSRISSGARRPRRSRSPRGEHYAPVLVAAAAAAVSNSGKVAFPIEGFWMDGAFTRRSVQFG